MSNWRKRHQQWMDFVHLDEELHKQLKNMQENAEQLEDCFYKDLEFGTGGIRGEMGPGPNRMNIYTVRKTSEGLARYIEGHGGKAKQNGIAIAYDSRHRSAVFALEAAKVMGRHDITVYLFDRLSPTPLLSFAVRLLNAFAGIVITASHNPPEYNGYKVYGADGCQITLAVAEQIMEKVNEVEDELTIPILGETELKQSGRLSLIHDEILERYLSCLESIRITPPLVSTASQVKIVFSPLHGTSYESMMQVMERFGYHNISVVREQAYPDPDFSNVVSANPEELQAFELAIKYGNQENADFLIATDPDADRLGIAVKDRHNEFIVFTGNQIGALLLHYLLSLRKQAGLLPDNGVVLKTIVTTEMARAISSDFGVETVDTLTGFKFIGEKMSEYEKSAKYRFQFGFEESNGYVIGDFVRDKDGIQTALMVADMCAYYKTDGKTLYDALMDLFAKYGYYSEDIFSITQKGKEGADKMASIMNFFRQTFPTGIAGKKVTKIEDYLSVADHTLPKSNVLKFYLADDSWFCLRPSGTEPKLKVYFGVKGTSLENSKQKLTLFKESVIALISRGYSGGA